MPAPVTRVLSANVYEASWAVRYRGCQRINLAFHNRSSQQTRLAAHLPTFCGFVPGNRCAHWLMAKAEEGHGEDTFNALFDHHTLYQAWAIVLKDPYEELVRTSTLPPSGAATSTTFVLRSRREHVSIGDWPLHVGTRAAARKNGRYHSGRSCSAPRRPFPPESSRQPSPRRATESAAPPLSAAWASTRPAFYLRLGFRLWRAKLPVGGHLAPRSRQRV